MAAAPAPPILHMVSAPRYMPPPHPTPSPKREQHGLAGGVPATQVTTIVINRDRVERGRGRGGWRGCGCWFELLCVEGRKEGLGGFDLRGLCGGFERGGEMKFDEKMNGSE